MTNAKPVVGDIVHYINNRNNRLAAIVTRVRENGTVDLTIFLSGCYPNASFSAMTHVKRIPESIDRALEALGDNDRASWRNRWCWRNE